jgi:16S rRNA (adenine(1408)-N(1))-methyltransferase
VVRGKLLAPLADGDLDALLAAAGKVIVDVGTGDARAAYRTARAHPDRLVIGVDPAWQRMVETATRAARKPAKGGAANLLLVCASAESLPAALHGIADEVLVALPWGKLLRGVVLGDADVCTGLRTLARGCGATLEVTVGTSIWRDPVPLDIRDLPELTPGYVAEVLAPRLAGHGWRVDDFALEGGRGPSSWSRRLGSSAPEVFAHLRASAC